MAHIVICKRDMNNRLLVLLHRRSGLVREPFHWGIPGGAFENDERRVIKHKSVPNRIKFCIKRRAALRETVEEAGGGYLVNNNGEVSTPKQIFVDGIPEYGIPQLEFDDINLPPSVLKLADINSRTKVLQARYGTDRETSVCICVLDPNIDNNYINYWIPRAIPHYRNEIDETYTKGNCIYGYKWYLSLKIRR